MEISKEPDAAATTPASDDDGPWVPAPDHVDPTITEVDAQVKDPDPLPHREPGSSGRSKRSSPARKRPAAEPKKPAARSAEPDRPASTSGRPSNRDEEPWRLRPRGLESDGLRERWNELQIGFVDDPRSAVLEADALAAEVASAVVAALEERRTALRTAWEDADNADTEVLRLALRDYRSFVRQLNGDDGPTP
ncbi:hypothetical protein [Nocardiopsis sp. MG754419]|uniref:hypothetical protein n=1 Tax=Nocardiopsis sp. MG754419 TaxID=2259865 RepID=UPI001BA9F510|nr:hypothetical protein [Nocardiopsis sp. MG754419]